MFIHIYTIEEHSKESREISTLTFTGGRKDLDVIRNLTKEYRKKVQKVIDDSKSFEQVFQLNIQCFPISQNFKESL